MEISERLLKQLRERLKDRGLTLTEVAAKLDTSHASLSRLLNGHNRLTLTDLSRMSQILGVPMSTLLKEAELGNGKRHISPELESFICEDRRIWGIFVALNFANTTKGVALDLGIEEGFVEATLKRFELEEIVCVVGPGLYQLTEHAKDISFGRTQDFYELKSELYMLQSEGTYRALDRGPTYWNDKDDSLLVAKLSASQALSIARQLESIQAQLRAMDRMNEENGAASKPRSEDATGLHTVFLALKPVTKELLRGIAGSHTQ